MACQSPGPFESIESAQEYLGLLSQAIEESQEAIADDISSAQESGSTRNADALRLVLYNLDKLSTHVKVSRRLLNDLRMLRRLLHRQREALAA